MRFKVIAACLLFLVPNLVFAWARRDFFAQFPNHYFLETGTMEGHGLREATRGGGFEEYHSIELSEYYYNLCREAFQADPRIHLWQGDSGQVLEEVIQNMHQPITFWLDGHYSGNQTAKAETNSPLMRELEAIKRHPIKNHVILIDDVRLFGTEEFDFLSLQEVVQKIKEINPCYEFFLQDGACPQDILVAVVP